jgi:peptidoglycan/LPS O-acetylase OafA/YrhL
MRIEQLTFTRFIAAMAIVVYHFGDHSFLFTNKYVAFLFNQANFGVSYFFILSGFVMIVAYSNKEKIYFVEYIKNRLARIYPIYIIASLLLLITFYIDDLYDEVKVADLLLYIFMLQSWVPSKALLYNYPGWSLSVEMFFYISFPLLFNFFYKKDNLKNISIGIVLFWFVSQVIFHLVVQMHFFELPFFSKRDLLYHPLLHFNEFLVGNLLGLYYVQKSTMKPANYLRSIFLLLLFLVFLLKFRFGLNFHNGLLSIVFAPLILFISLSNDSFTKFFVNPKLVFLGEISFGIYILQVPIWSIVSDYRLNKYLGLDYIEDFTLSFIIRLIILIVFSSLSYLYFETPIRNRIKNIDMTKNKNI